MATTINADTVSGGAIVTGDASGVLALQAAGNTALTLNSSRAIGVGASPSYGTSGQVLTSAGSAAAPTWGAVGVAGGGTGATTLTTNNVILGNGTSAVQFVAPSTSGNVLTSNGTTWTSAAAPAGNLVLLSTTNVTAGTTTTDITSGFGSTYSNYMLFATNIVMSAASQTMTMLVNYGGTYLTSGYSSVYPNNATWNISTGDTALRICGTSVFDQGSFVLFINGVNSSAKKTSFSWTGANASQPFLIGGGTNTSTATVSGVRFQVAGITFSSGTFYLYGVKKT